jgi:hypothetical protein
MVKNNAWNFDTTYGVGDILYASNSSTLSKLNAGSTGQVLTVLCGFLLWLNVNASSVNNLNFTNADDMISGNLSFSQSSWYIEATGTHLAPTFADYATHPGQYNVDTGSDTTGSKDYSYGLLPGDRSGAYLFGGGQYNFEIIGKFSNLSTSGQRYKFRMGYLDAVSSGTIQNGCWFEYTDNVNSGNWQVLTRKASTTTTGNTSNTPDTNWHKYNIIVNAAATSVSFYIDDVLVSSGAITTNIPNTAGQAVGLVIQIVKSTGTINRIFFLDYTSHNIQLTNSRV